MIQEDKKLQTVASADEYLAPKIKVKKVGARRIICSSITNMTDGGSQDDSNFENQ